LNRKPRINPLKEIRELLKANRYRMVSHAIARTIERSVALRDILFVLNHGVHEVSQDGFDVKRQSARYAIRGKTPDGVDLRVAVAIENMVVIITVIKPRR
jgi:hypothetical protein